MVRVDQGRYSCSAIVGTLLIADGCDPAPPPPPPDDFVVCREFLLPDDAEGDLSAQIIGTTPDDHYRLAPAAKGSFTRVGGRFSVPFRGIALVRTKKPIDAWIGSC